MVFCQALVQCLRRQPALVLVLAAFAVLPVYTHWADLPFWDDVAIRIMLLGMAAMGLNLALGYGGMVSFGHAAFIGAGAYCVGISQQYGLYNGWILMGLSIAVCAALSTIIGLLSLRTSGLYFIMITLAFAQMLFFFFVSLETFGGDDGMSIDRAEFYPLDLYNPLHLYYLVWAVLVLVSLVLLLIVHSRFGVILRGIKDNEWRIEALGFTPLWHKLIGYLISAMICGLAGSLMASWQEYVSPDLMHWTRSGELMIVIVLGGLGYFVGPLVGAVVFLLLEEMLPELLRLIAPEYTENWMIIFGPLLIAVVLFARGGVMGAFGKLGCLVSRPARRGVS